MLARQYQIRMTCLQCQDKWLVTVEVEVPKGETMHIPPRIVGEHQSCTRRAKSYALGDRTRYEKPNA